MPLTYDFADRPDAPTRWEGLAGYPPLIYRINPEWALSPTALPHDASGNVPGTHEATSAADYIFTAGQQPHLMLRAPQDGYSEVGQQFPPVPLDGFVFDFDLSMHGVNGREWMAVVIQPAHVAVPDPIGPDYAGVTDNRPVPPLSLPPAGSVYMNTRLYNGFPGWNARQVGGALLAGESDSYPWHESSNAAQAAYADAMRDALADQRIRLPYRLAIDAAASTLSLTIAGYTVWTRSLDLAAYTDGVSVMLMSVNYNAAKDGGSQGGWAWHVDNITFQHVDAGTEPAPEPEPEPEPVVVGAEVWTRDELSDGTYSEPEWRPLQGA